MPDAEPNGTSDVFKPSARAAWHLLALIGSVAGGSVVATIFVVDRFAPAHAEPVATKVLEELRASDARQADAVNTLAARVERMAKETEVNIGRFSIEHDLMRAEITALAARTSQLELKCMAAPPGSVHKKK